MHSVREFVELAFQEINQEIMYVNDNFFYSFLKNKFDVFRCGHVTAGKAKV
jgi:hypothetical protein